MIIAIDFDGTIVEHRFPEIGEPLPHAFEVMQALQEAGHKLILWTYRDGEDLKKAVRLCRENGIRFYAVNHSKPNEDYDKYMSRKIYADIYIDDRNLGGFPGWLEVQRMILEDGSHGVQFETSSSNTRKTVLQEQPITERKRNFSVLKSIVAAFPF